MTVQASSSPQSSPAHVLVRAEEESSFALSDEKRKRWNEWGFDPALLESDPLSVNFLTESLLGETIALFQRSGHVLLENDLGVQNREGRAFIKVEGEWVPCSQILGQIQYAQQLDKSFGVCNLIGWNYIHPDGLVKKDAYCYKELYPIGKLAPQVHQSLLQEGLRWLHQHPEFDDKKERPCLLQVVTSQELEPPEGWIFHNVKAVLPQHAFIRLVDEQGKLYSFGSRSPYSKETSLSGVSNFLSTWSTHLCTPDYIERWTVPLRRVTTIPLTLEQFANEVKFANEMNSGTGLRFNFVRQNCVRIVQQALHVAGIDIDTKISIPALAYAALPSLSDYPVVGNTLSRMASVAQSFFSTISAPQLQPPEAAVRVLEYVPQKACALTVSGIELCLGGARMAPRDETEDKHKEDTTANGKRLTSFSKLITLQNCTDTENCYLYHNYPLIVWQEDQISTFEYRSVPGFCIDPAMGSQIRKE